MTSSPILALGENGVELLPGWSDYIIAGEMKKLVQCAKHEGGDPAIREPPAMASLQLRFIIV